MAVEQKEFRSLLLKYFPLQLRDELSDLTMIYEIDNNTKGFEIKRLLTDYGVPYTSLGSGTNRFGVLIDGYAIKIALDVDGKIDNKREFRYSEELYPYVVKCYECSYDGLLAVTEYVEIFNLDAFYRYQDKMKEILSNISDRYLIGDVGITTKNYINWGIRHNGKDEICIMDFAYIYSVDYGTFTCSCDRTTLIKYDNDYVNFICPRCGRKYTFGEIRRKVTRKVQDQEIGDIAENGYVLHSERETLPINPKFTKVKTNKKKKEPTETEIEIQKHRERQAEYLEMLKILNGQDSENDE